MVIDERSDAVPCPLCRTVIQKNALFPNHALQGLINEQLVYCYQRSKGVYQRKALFLHTFVPNFLMRVLIGCTAQFPLSALQSHADVCEFKSRDCPNASLGGKSVCSECIVCLLALVSVDPGTGLIVQVVHLVVH